MSKARDKLKYENLVKRCPDFEGVISRKAWTHIGQSNIKTTHWLKKLWGSNIEANVKNKLWKKHGSVRKDCIELGKNKALIGVGAGQSFNKNKDILKQVVDLDGVQDWKNRDFIIAASNHMYKPLLAMGIIPDFVSLVDGSDVVMGQLNEDIPPEGQNSILLTGLHCSPKVLKEWSKQGREIRFYMPATEGLSEIFERITRKKAIHHEILQGGNVLNTLFSIGLRFLHTTTFMALGNDLSYPVQDKLEEQRRSYYADGDYTSNAKGTGTGRDEASAGKKWLGFTLSPAVIQIAGLDRYSITLDIVGTSPTLWVYKTWIEANVLLNAKGETAYHYYNCSEGGIAGVMNKDMKLRNKELRKDENWYLFDEVCPRWHTRTFKDAVQEFLKAKEALWEPKVMLPDAQAVGGLALRN